MWYITYLVSCLAFYMFLQTTADDEDEKLMAATIGAPMAAAWPLTVIAFWYLAGQYSDGE